ncbi:MAG: carboxypeptidase-like regulatory domain-containing protein [Ignavibacteria bacterium]
MKTKFLMIRVIFLKLIIINIIFIAYPSQSSCRSYHKAVVVSGRIVDERNFPVQSAKIIITGQEVQSDKYGKFRFLNVTIPYDVVIAERSSSTAVIYKNITIEDPELILFGKPSARNSNTAIINVKFAEVPAGSSAIIKFISSDVFYSEEVEVLSGEKSKTLLIEWPETQNTLNGNVIYLQKSNALYQSFIDKSISIYKNTVPFELAFSGTNSNTLSSDVTIYLPYDNYRSKGYSVYADFFSYNRNSILMLTREEGDIFKTKSIIPLKLPISYRVKVSGFVDYDDGSGFENYIYSKPGAVINLETEEPPKLQTPSDKLNGASGNTEFSYSNGSGTGIYVIHFHSFYPNMNFYVVTNEKSSNLSYLSRTEFQKINSVEFKWNVKKYLTYFSVNDFVKPKVFNNDIGYKAVLRSAERTFKTGYF